MMTTSTRPYITHYDDSKDYWFAGGLARILGESEKTDGAFSLLHMTLPQGHASPLHIHHAHDEAFFVLHGEMKGVFGDSEWAAGSGAFVFLPRGIRHAFQATSKLPTEVLVMSIPGGFDEFVVNAGDKYEEGMDTSYLGPDPDMLTRIAARHDIEIIGPPVDFLG